MKSVLIIGATQGTGFQLAAEYARQGANVVITGRDAQRAAEVAGELSEDVTGTVTGIALDLARPSEIAGALASIERVDRIAIIGAVRDRNTIAAYDVVKATEMAVTKIVGYTAVVSTLAGRMAPGASVLIFGGMAKAYPYPGSTTVTAVNSAVTGVVRTMSVELAPVRVNAIHPGPIEDSPFWQDETRKSMVDVWRKQSLTGELARMGDIVNACSFPAGEPARQRYRPARGRRTRLRPGPGESSFASPEQAAGHREDEGTAFGLVRRHRVFQVGPDLAGANAVESVERTRPATRDRTTAAGQTNGTQPSAVRPTRVPPPRSRSGPPDPADRRT